MARAKRSKHNKTPGPPGSAPPRPAGTGLHQAHAAPSSRRLRLLVGLLLILTCVAVGRWLSRSWTGSLPDIPVVVLDDVDPEVVAAITQARAEVQKAPRSLQAWAGLAMLLDAHEYVSAAATCYAAAETLDPDNPFWPYLQAKIFLNGAHPELALPCLERAARRAPASSPLPRLRLADLLLTHNRIDDAEREFRKVLADIPGDSYARFGLAQVAMARNQLQDSLRYLTALTDEPHIRKHASGLAATVFERLGDHKRADDERRRLADLPEDQPWPDIFPLIHQLRVGLRGRLQRADAFRLQRQPAEAMALMKETVQLYPRSDLAWAGMGVALENAKDFAGAEQAYRTSIDLAPDRAESYFALGDLLQGRQRYQEATSAFRKASALRPMDANTYLRLGQCLQSQGDKAGAKEAFRQALRYDPNLSEARQQLEK